MKEFLAGVVLGALLLVVGLTLMLREMFKGTNLT